MANKYTHWYRNDFYSDKVMLAEQYRDLIEVPFYYGKDCGLKIRTYRKPPANSKKERLEYVESLIVGILAAGQSMTMHQLKSYLLLKNIAISNMVLKGKIEWLMQRGMLERNTICDIKDPIQKGDSGKTANVVSYRLTRRGCMIAETLGLPKYSIESYYQMTNSHRGKMSLLTRSILWNQIILNQMLYNPDFLWFRVGEVYRLNQGKYMELPLYVKTIDGEYYFEYLHAMGNIVIEKTFSLWMEYARQKGRPFTFVLVTDDRYNVASIIGQHVNRAKAASIKVATSVVNDWFKEEAGVVMMATDYL